MRRRYKKRRKPSLTEFFSAKRQKLADGEYTGQLYRKNKIMMKWEEPSGSPVIACKVESGVAQLTVERPIYGKEHNQIQRLLQIHVELGGLQSQYLACLGRQDVLVPTPVLSLADEFIQILDSLYAAYQPEYLQNNVYPDVVSLLKQIASSIKNSYDVYASTPHSDDYITEIGKCIGDIQIAIQSVLEPLNIDGVIK